MQGRRLYCDDSGDFWLDPEHSTEAGDCQPGDYWQAGDGWAGKVPNGMRCGLRHHVVTEYPDGTITVAPSILLTCPGAPEWDWHGFLERGVWRTC
jgi:hypothetical protein